MEIKNFDVNDACLYFVESAGVPFEMLRRKLSEFSQTLENTGKLFFNIVNCVFIEHPTKKKLFE